jgi:Ion channel
MFSPVLLAAAVMICSLLSFSLATVFTVHLVVHLFRSGYTGRSLWKNVAFMVVVSLVTAAAHLIQIGLWAAAYFMIGEFSTFDRAFYFSSQNYPALGYGDVVLSAEWRLLGPLESINGLLLFGLSSGVMFAVMSRLIKNRLHFELGYAEEGDLAKQSMSAHSHYGTNSQ